MCTVQSAWHDVYGAICIVHFAELKTIFCTSYSVLCTHKKALWRPCLCFGMSNLNFTYRPFTFLLFRIRDRSKGGEGEVTKRLHKITMGGGGSRASKKRDYVIFERSLTKLSFSFNFNYEHFHKCFNEHQYECLDN